jgi:hypothetical protein
MSTNLKWLILILILIINLQTYAYKNVVKTLAAIDDSDDQRRELENKKFNLSISDKRDEKIDNNRKSVTEGSTVGFTVGIEIEDTEEYETETDPNDDYYEEEFNTRECILARSEFYLSWWVHENGSLRLPTSVRLNGSGILDLSLHFTTEDAIYTHVLSFTTDNPSDVSQSQTFPQSRFSYYYLFFVYQVIRFMSVASNKLSNIPTSALNLTSSTLQYLSLAGNNFHDLFESYNTSFREFAEFMLINAN